MEAINAIDDPFLGFLFLSSVEIYKVEFAKDFDAVILQECQNYPELLKERFSYIFRANLDVKLKLLKLAGLFQTYRFQANS